MNTLTENNAQQYFATGITVTVEFLFFKKQQHKYFPSCDPKNRFDIFHGHITLLTGGCPVTDWQMQTLHITCKQ